MPIHDWSKVEAGLFHHFHQQWSGELCDALNSGVSPKGFFALIEQKAIWREPDVLTLKGRTIDEPVPETSGSSGVSLAPPKTRYIVRESETEAYARKANRIGVRNRRGELVAVIEIVSPGNKDSRRAITAFVNKTVEFLDRGIHVLIVDLIPPTSRDPHGIHKRIWDEFQDDDFVLSPDELLTFASYVSDVPKVAYVETAAVGDLIPAMPVFLDPETHVTAPLEESYMRTWEKCPGEMQKFVLQPD